MKILALVLLVLTAVWILSWYLRRRERNLYPDPETADELHWVRTSDGVRIALYRYRSRIEEKREPVLCVHGLGANHLNLAYNEAAGVAQYLANRGYDVFAIDLRGRGASDFPTQSWCFDDYVEKDLPAAIDHILKVTGFPRLHWVGHSMGGMLFYAVAGNASLQEKIASAVTLGSPVRFYHPRPWEFYGVKLYRYLLPLRYFDSRRWIRILLPFFLRRRRALRIFFNPANMDPYLLRWAARYALGTLAIRELYQFARWILEHHFRSLDNHRDYREGIRTITVPTRIIAGSGDYLCPPYTVRPGYDLLGASEKSYIEAGLAQGFSQDYGHIDLVFGIRARHEIFSLILEWLRRHSASSQASSREQAVSAGAA